MKNLVTSGCNFSIGTSEFWFLRRKRMEFDAEFHKIIIQQNGAEK